MEFDKLNLMLWRQNENGSNFFQTDDGKDLTFALCPFFEEVFREIETEISNKKKNSITKLWVKTCEEKTEKVRNYLWKLFNVDATNDPENKIKRIDLVCNKFKGNLGEIFADYFFRLGKGSDYVEPSSYKLVDPHNERFYDATANDSRYGNKICIQIKNYSHEIPLKKFKQEISPKLKATAFDMACNNELWFNSLREFDGIVRPSQILFSFTNIQSNENWERFSELFECNRAIIFLGPDYINSKNLQQSPIFFKKIVDEISKYNQRCFLLGKLI